MRAVGPAEYGKKDGEAEKKLWSSRMYTAPMLLEWEEIYDGEGGDLQSLDVRM